MDVGEVEVSALKLERQPGVVDSELVENRGVEVVDVQIQFPSNNLSPRIVPPAMIVPPTTSRASNRTRNPPCRRRPKDPSLIRTRRPLKIDSFTPTSSKPHQARPLKPHPPANPVS